MAMPDEVVGCPDGQLVTYACHIWRGICWETEVEISITDDAGSAIVGPTLEKVSRGLMNFRAVTTLSPAARFAGEHFSNICAPLSGVTPVVCSEGRGVQFVSNMRMLKAAFVMDTCPKDP